jgi:L-rhamnose isomerase
MMSQAPASKQIESASALAKERYAVLGVDVERSLSALAKISPSLHCCQGDDVAGFESPDSELTGGIAATGNYPGKAAMPPSYGAISTRPTRLFQACTV